MKTASPDQRLHAVKKLEAHKVETHRIRTDDETQSLLHELMLHQIELEIMHTDLTLRSAELEAANIELESFNYSLSHDLRMPLTIINSYCQVIMELGGNRLDNECSGYIHKIFEGTLRMNQLIKSMLDFSLVTRVKTRHETMDLSAMARFIAEELKMAEPQRRVTFISRSGISGKGDEGLWRIVLDNLIGNAWKFTGSRDEAVIEFGVTEIYGNQACFIRDNGPGFDMEQAQKLFLPFHRIPGTNVEGNGIGLATVEKIVKRQGGRVWAESTPGEGATFLFTLA